MGRQLLEITDENLLPSKDESRQNIQPIEVLTQEKLNIDSIFDLANQQSKVLFLKTLLESDWFFEMEKEFRENGEKNFISLLTRMRDNFGIEIAWYKKSYQKAKDGENEKNVFVMTDKDGKKTKFRWSYSWFKKGRSYRYPMRQFSKEEEWCRDLIDQLEAKFAVIRQQSEILARVRQLMRDYQRLNEVFYADKLTPEQLALVFGNAQSANEEEEE